MVFFLVSFLYMIFSQILTSFPKNNPLDAPFQSDLARSKTVHCPIDKGNSYICGAHREY